MQPTRPQAHQGQSHYSGYSGTGASAAQAVAAALSNPYGQAQYGYPQAAHYAQAYAQYYNGPGPSAVTAQGYTISSTYVPGTQYNAPYGSRQHSAQRPQPHSHAHGGGQPGGWYQPGTIPCSQQGCSFMGSKKAVEIHLMDRHLIYPQGWEHRKRKNDWDADPSLKGKPVPIQGTSIKLDTPEAIAAWIAERKKRFPTAQNVADKEQKMREAVERGQLPFDDGNSRKRRRIDDGNGEQRGNFRGRGTIPVDTKLKPLVDDEQNSGSNSDSDSDDAPEIVSSKAPPGTSLDADDGPPREAESNHDDDAKVDEVPAHAAQPPLKKPRPKQPRRPLYNPFTQRPSLLRNLLMPEIRMTVSNLSQAIHFLVDNDFLDNVELKPGQANTRMIEVIGEQSATNLLPTESAADGPTPQPEVVMVTNIS
ncbi:hypothetical protein L226DRAFT_564663 [Lentinus tigrinus ALCF2SS1-7]|uniref:uncharacterized protein n=1 Tax=Lentinus tigrinus ALCF2SS1-7 TaxID=1328758 RepID=UPI001165EF6B|nr:hypothetical protein L226DRAFT_564663 [Lentinus tigrinus ALCF2SS1-7]